MKNNIDNKLIKIFSLIALLVVAITGLILLMPESPGTDKVEELAVCLSEKGAKFYGAFWCSHCINQKKMFENSDKLPYIECSTPDGEGQTAICAAEKIMGYPTWRFADGTEKSGELSFNELATYSGCPAL